jgi:hypothetical protein
MREVEKEMSGIIETLPPASFQISRNWLSAFWNAGSRTRPSTSWTTVLISASLRSTPIPTQLSTKRNNFETYRMKVVKKPDGQSAVQVHRKGVEFQPERMLMTINDIETATVLQWASLVLLLWSSPM